MRFLSHEGGGGGAERSEVSEGVAGPTLHIDVCQGLPGGYARRIVSWKAAVATCLIVMLGASCADGPTPWERFRGGYNAERLRNVIGDQSLFVGAYNFTYESLGDCGTAYDSAAEAQSDFRELPEEIIAAGEQAEQAYYDEKVAVFMASEEWLKQHGCPGATDFMSVG